MFAARKTDGAVATTANYIEDVFSTYLWIGTDATQTINNGIDLSTNGGLVWMKRRDASGDHGLFDTIRGSNRLISNSTAAQAANTQISSFNTNGFTLSGGGDYNSLFGGVGQTTVGWTFREQAKFFDVVTYTGNGANNRQISHNLGSAPGCIILKRTDGTGDWWTYHRSLGDVGGFSYDLQLNTTSNKTAYQIFGTGATQTSTYFTLGTVFAAEMNGNGANYVAYLFAHDAGGFGATGTDNVISCGTFTASATETATVTLGYEPQWLLFKPTSTTGDWQIVDNMRRWPVASDAYSLKANLSAAEANFGAIKPSATGFYATSNLIANATYIYIAIRRGPMKTPTSGTSVFSPVKRTGTGAIANVNCGFAPDMVGMAEYPAAIQTGQKGFTDKLRGGTQAVYSSNTTGELASGDITQFQNNGVTFRAGGDYNVLNALYINWFFGRAPGFFDVVCYTGTGSATTQTHNLGAAPELLIIKSRDTAVNWVVWASAPTPQQNQYALNLNTAGTWGSSGDKNWGATLTGAPNMTSTNFSLGDYVGVNGSAKTYVAYLFATLTGVSKVGSYTGNGSSQTINCGFAAGARFILIKRTDSTGDWYVWDTARGIVAGNDPRLSLNTTAAEVTTDDSIDPDNSGFIVNQLAATNINVNAASYIFLAVS